MNAPSSVLIMSCYTDDKTFSDVCVCVGFSQHECFARHVAMSQVGNLAGTMWYLHNEAALSAANIWARSMLNNRWCG